jgi:hypothetical protein
MFNTFEKPRPALDSMLITRRPVLRITSPEAFRRVSLRLNVAGRFISRQRFILIMAACSLFLLASICLGG